MLYLLLMSFCRRFEDSEITKPIERFYEDVVTQSREITTAPELPRVRKKKFPDKVIRT